MLKGNRSTATRLDETPQFNCDVGLGLRMQLQEDTNDEYSPYPSKRVMTSPHFGGGSAFSQGGKGGGGIGSMEGAPPFFKSTTNQPFAPVAGAPFTTSQRDELERQNMVFKYLTAYNSVPADLILPFSRNPTSQNSGKDSEPWRCRRTDGKKWRCARDVTPDRKFCEKHAHKSRKSSRKHVEVQSNNINYSQQKDTPILDNPLSNVSRKGSTTTCEQTSSIGWLMKGSTLPSTISQVLSCSQEQKQKQIQSSARMGLSDRDSSSKSYENHTVLQPQENDQDKQETINWNPYMGDDYYPYFDPKVMTSSPQRSPTRPFIEAWPSHEIFNQKGSLSFSSGSRELPLSSLTLSVSGVGGVVEDNEAGDMKPQWMMSNISWLNSTGGPLGEALCPGNGGKGASDASPHGSSNSFSNTTSSCSKGSCEEGSHQFNFFG